MKKKGVYDFIFAGAGAATLQLLGQLLDNEKFANASILILEKDATKTNDRTWCFWEGKENSPWHQTIAKSWDCITFQSPTVELQASIAPMAYKKIRSDAYYKSMRARIAKHHNVDLRFEAVEGFQEHPELVTVTTNKNRYKCTYFFNSILDWNVLKKQTNYPVLQQHFVGWFIKTDAPCFDDTSATFMDFSVPQKGNTRFMYVLPTSATEALVEYTLFSENLLKKAEYECEIRAYLSQKNIRNYTIEETEQGSIPMTCYRFAKHNSKRVLHIGSAGGWTKASTGFTFKTIERKAKQLVEFLQKNDNMKGFEKRSRFWWYDLLFLDVLARHNNLGSFLFSRMFQRNNPLTILRFLDEKTTFLEEVKIMRSFPVGLFVKQLFRRLARALH